MRVRQAVLSDLPEIAATDGVLTQGSPRWDEVHDLLAGGQCLLGEVLSGDTPSVVGYVAVAPHHFFGRDFVALLVVADAWRRRGIGRQLVTRRSSSTVESDHD